MIKSSIVWNPSYSQVALALTCLECSASTGKNKADFRNFFLELCSKDNQPPSRPFARTGLSNLAGCSRWSLWFGSSSAIETDNGASWKWQSYVPTFTSLKHILRPHEGAQDTEYKAEVPLCHVKRTETSGLSLNFLGLWTIGAALFWKRSPIMPFAPLWR